MVEEVTLPELSSESKARIDRMFFGCQEVIGVEHLESVFRGAASHSGAVSYTHLTLPTKA